jgi:dienelactone hydrolase
MKLTFSPLLVLCTLLVACNNPTPGKTSENNTDSITTKVDKADVEEQVVEYAVGGTTFKGYVAYDGKKLGKRPVILVLPEWWGLNDYVKMRAKMLAQLGYLAMAIDVFGNGKVAADPDEAQKLTAPFYSKPLLGKQRLDAALAKARTLEQADTSQTGAIGYCFGGSVVLQSALNGSDLDGAVAFHAQLHGIAAKQKPATKILVCHGGSDQFVKPADVDAFKRSMDGVGADYSFKVYPNSTHAFTNPDATETGKKFKLPIQYNAGADTASWNDMKEFLAGVFH